MILFYVSVNETIVLKARIKWRKGGMGGEEEETGSCFWSVLFVIDNIQRLDRYKMKCLLYRFGKRRESSSPLT